MQSPPPSLSAPHQRRVLIVSPHFPPINAPDHQRIRTALPYLREQGWEAHILTVHPDQVNHPQDPYLEATLPEDTAVTRIPAFPIDWTRKVGLGNLGLRCLPFMAQAGDRLLSRHPFDLVFFSTTIFPVMVLGDRWQRRWGVPFVLDFQDPWRVESAPTRQRPGGRFKYALDKFLASQLEPLAMRSVRQIISVSPAYPPILQHHYPWLREEQFTTLPFGAPEQDFEQLPRLQIQQQIFNPNDEKRHWVYVGRGGSDMEKALRSLFLAIRQERDRQPEVWQTIHLHFVGTHYATGVQCDRPIETIAQDYGLADQVSEHPQRIPYFEAQQVLQQSDAILLIGSTDPTYTASKLYPCILARKPILAIFHQRSSVVDILHTCNAGQIVTFDDQDTPESLQPEITPKLNWLTSLPSHYQPETDWAAFHPYTAREMTRRLCQVFDRAVHL